MSCNYWWVNHKQTFKSELAGGYIWSPKNNRDGARNQTYENLTEVKPGDVVVSYADAQIKAVGIAMEAYRESDKPVEFGKTGDNWLSNGWLVSIEWLFLQNAIKPKMYIDDIKPLLPEKNSPLQGNGNGNQGCYLAKISPELGNLILKLIALENPATEIELENLADNAAEDVSEKNIQNSLELLGTEKDQMIRARRGQGFFRIGVLTVEPRCRITDVDNPSFLVASHIKPWCVCSKDEKLDKNNGLMLAPHVDLLFDRGWISFEDNGTLLVAVEALPVLDSWKISPETSSEGFTKEQQVYLSYHRANIFRGTLI